MSSRKGGRGKPRQTSKFISFHFRVKILKSSLTTWNLKEGDLIKVMFEIAKEILVFEINSGKCKGEDINIQINTHNHKRVCPFNQSLIQESSGAVIEIEMPYRIYNLGG